MRTTCVLIAMLAAAPLQAQTGDNLKTTNIQRYYMPVRLFLQGAFSFLHTSVHNNEIYGNIVGYLRANHITPPSTEMVQEMIKSKKTPQQMMQEMMEKYNKKK